MFSAKLVHQYFLGRDYEIVINQGGFKPNLTPQPFNLDSIKSNMWRVTQTMQALTGEQFWIVDGVAITIMPFVHNSGKELRFAFMGSKFIPHEKSTNNFLIGTSVSRSEFFMITPKPIDFGGLFPPPPSEYQGLPNPNIFSDLDVQFTPEEDDVEVMHRILSSIII